MQARLASFQPGITLRPPGRTRPAKAITHCLAPAPPAPQVAHRCPCTSADVCGALEERVKQLAAEGKLPPFAVAGRTVEPDKMGMEAW